MPPGVAQPLAPAYRQPQAARLGLARRVEFAAASPWCAAFVARLARKPGIVAMVNEVEPIPAAELGAMLASHGVHPLVFVLAPWPEIYRTDAERDQSFAHAVAVHARLVKWYLDCGYGLHEVPRLPVAERARHVLQALGASAARPPGPD